MKLIRLIKAVSICAIASATLNVYAKDDGKKRPTLNELMAENAYIELAERNELSKPVVSSWEQKTMKSEGGKTTEVVESWKVETRIYSKPKSDKP
ncbi:MULTISPECIES: hypothetical protein [Shewanella]|jgi:hypothetical protein|uniref:Uncharacterized protein n=1 Tax=Shewanella decolorationis TaxID=256839 RepID=A0A5B8R2Q3_9GAMM|nr:MULTISPECIES: hypothetical protein [Shewanella]QXN27207.1 hypothetical protein KVP08_022200 [Shewanella putrefaciens]MBW0278557.1 hypothetical protein [Shewanella xiamenensis]MCB2384511.1 hypothetical protein [Shewanella sp. SR1]MCS6211753.1 hypothetical protein [Shewanella baltica]MCU7988823.1 hypothetical protein [Shewanella sp. SW24]